MKSNFHILILALLVAMIAGTTGCKTYMKLKHGMAVPAEETPESLISFLEKHKFPAGDLYMFSDSTSYYRLMKNTVYMKHFLSHMIFDRNGLLLQRDTAECQWAGSDAIRALDPRAACSYWPGFTLDQILPFIKPFGRKEASWSTEKNPDFTIIVTWGKFLGQYNYRLFDLEKAVRENKTAAIRVVWLNIDLQQSWHVTEQQKLRIK